jgi:hypothetical protein
MSNPFRYYDTKTWCKILVIEAPKFLTLDQKPINALIWFVVSLKKKLWNYEISRRRKKKNHFFEYIIKLEKKTLM